MARDQNNHPVWGVYNELRTAKLNLKYYGYRLSRYEKINKSIEIIIAITTSSSVAGFSFLQIDPVKNLWYLIGSIAVVIAIINPILGLTKKIKDYENVITGYASMVYDLNLIKLKVEQLRKYDDEMQKRLFDIMDGSQNIIKKKVESKPNFKTRRKAEAEIRKELPGNSFYIP